MFRHADRNAMWLAASLALALPTFAATPSGSAASAAPAPSRRVSLLETRPIETTLGNPEIPDALTTWLELIDGARRSIDLEHFYLSTWPGEPTDQVLAALGRAVARGVRVRLLLDGGMYRTYPRAADSLAAVTGFEVRLIDARRLLGGVQHAKFFVVDRSIVVVGSQNLDWRALKHIHEIGVQVRDLRMALDFSRLFELDWSVSRVPGTPPDTTLTTAAAARVSRTGAVPYRIVEAPGDTVLAWPSWSPRRFSPDSTLWDLDRLVALLDGARREVVAQVLSYGIEAHGTRDTTLDQAIRRAAARGVKVRLIASDWMMGSSSLPALKRLAQVPNVEVKLTTVSRWSGGYIPFARVEHAKFLVVDATTSWIGTSNWDPSYFFTSRNAAITLLDPRTARQLLKTFEISWSATGSQTLDPARTYPAKVRGEEPPPGATKYGG
ncbi:MAG: hypothetical protein HOP12_09530 [Candidatus Eisenbacteria bacterium]|uniref:PLD phosphodiesterase domain-containing protein n=1 Tax=Eiseniibacteriota bacterium TaxID=2212470 RepID=A0A849SNH7_UNCEI|nr:hypothetical protein [Candidatus Eisenbacteria bacterium]